MDLTKDEMENNHHVQKRNAIWHEEEPKSEICAVKSVIIKGAQYHFRTKLFERGNKTNT